MNFFQKLLILAIVLQLMSACNEHSSDTQQLNTPPASALRNNNDPMLFGADLREKSLTAATHVANWFIATSRSTDDNGLYWTVSNLSQNASGSMDTGATGIALFFLDFYRSNGDIRYLEIAKRIAIYIIRWQKTDPFQSHDWYAGISGSGHFLLDLYIETQDPYYLEQVTFAANWLLEKKLSDEKGGIYWLHSPNFPKRYTGIAHGNGGVGSFLIRVYQLTREPRYLDAALNAYQWLQHYKMEIGSDALAWKRLTEDNFYYNGWCGGAAGIVPFVMGLYQATGQQAFLDTIRQVANGLILTAHVTTQGKAWYRDEGSGQAYFTSYCQGAAGLVDTLFDIYQLIPETKYLDLAKEGLAWLQSRAISHEQGGVYWPLSDNYPRLDTGYQTGVASVARVFMRAYLLTSNSDYQAVVENASDLLLRIANRPTLEQLNWYAEVKKTAFSENNAAVFYGWADGAAGIGLYWLSVYRSRL